NLSTNSSTGPVGRLTEKSRASSGWRRKSPSATSLKPAASTSRRSTLSSMRWNVFPTVAPSPGRAEWSAITSIAAGLERRVEPAIHLGAIDLHISRVVVKEKESDEVEITHVGGQRVVERPRQHDDLGHHRRFHARLEALLRARA